MSVSVQWRLLVWMGRSLAGCRMKSLFLLSGVVALGTRTQVTFGLAEIADTEVENALKPVADLNRPSDPPTAQDVKNTETAYEKAAKALKPLLTNAPVITDPVAAKNHLGLGGVIKWGNLNTITANLALTKLKLLIEKKDTKKDVLAEYKKYYQTLAVGLLKVQKLLQDIGRKINEDVFVDKCSAPMQEMNELKKLSAGSNTWIWIAVAGVAVLVVAGLAFFCVRRK